MAAREKEVKVPSDQWQVESMMFLKLRKPLQAFFS
jgi:hypothetical protein